MQSGSKSSARCHGRAAVPDQVAGCFSSVVAGNDSRLVRAAALLRLNIVLVEGTTAAASCSPGSSEKNGAQDVRRTPDVPRAAPRPERSLCSATRRLFCGRRVKTSPRQVKAPTRYLCRRKPPARASLEPGPRQYCCAVFVRGGSRAGADNGSNLVGVEAQRGRSSHLYNTKVLRFSAEPESFPKDACSPCDQPGRRGRRCWSSKLTHEQRAGTTAIPTPGFPADHWKSYLAAVNDAVRHLDRGTGRRRWLTGRRRNASSPASPCRVPPPGPAVRCHLTAKHLIALLGQWTAPAW